MKFLKKSNRSEPFQSFVVKLEEVYLKTEMVRISAVIEGQ